MSDYASAGEIAQACLATWMPPPKLSLSEWADRHFYLSAESSAEAGRWTTLPYQRGMLDAITDPTVEQISVMKSARVGYTKCLNAAIGYFIHHDPCSILVVQPTVDDAKGYSKEEIAPMLRDCPELAQIIFEDSEEPGGPKGSANTILHKDYPGGVLSMVGANSGAGFRRISRRVVMFDEVDGYPPSAGSDGDQIKLGIKRTEYFWNRKIIAGSTPLVEGASRITDLFNQGDQRRYHVPCPQCGHMAPLVFSGTKGHVMRWNAKDGSDAFFECQRNGCVIEHKDKRVMVESGEWIAEAPFTGHASFHIWAAYSYSPNATWAQLVKEFIDANSKGSEVLRTFVNTVLGETWKLRGDAPDWEVLFRRREDYEIGSVPPGVVLITAGVDVQKDRWVYEVTGWGSDKQSWSLDAGVIMGDPANKADWPKLDELLGRTYVTETGTTRTIQRLAIDSGYNTNAVYSWAKRHPMSRVIAVKGVSTATTLIGTPNAVEVKTNGKRKSRGYRVWPVGVDMVKSELYGWLGLKLPLEGPPDPPAGYCHFPTYDAEYFKQLTAEQLVAVRDKKGYTDLEWQKLPGRENHFLDCRVYSRAAASSLGLDRKGGVGKPPPEEAPPPVEKPAAPIPAQPPTPVTSPPRADKPRPRRQGGGWLSRRR